MTKKYDNAKTGETKQSGRSMEGEPVFKVGGKKGKGVIIQVASGKKPTITKIDIPHGQNIPKFIPQYLPLRISAVTKRATELLGSENEALRWLGTPIRALDFATPISILGTAEGVERVNDVLGQMEHGIW